MTLQEKRFLHVLKIKDEQKEKFLTLWSFVRKNAYNSIDHNTNYANWLKYSEKSRMLWRITKKRTTQLLEIWKDCVSTKYRIVWKNENGICEHGEWCISKEALKKVVKENNEIYPGIKHWIESNM